MTTRRGFLSAMLAAAAAPAIVRAESLMPVVPRIWTPSDPFGQRGYLGTWEGFRIIESPPLTVEAVRRMKRAMLDNAILTQGGFVVMAHSGWEDDLRRIARK